MELTFRKKIFYFFPVLFCFCLPFGSLLLSGILVLWTVTSFFNIERGAVMNGIKGKSFLLLFVFFALTCLSALFSSNKQEAAFGIEIKLSFIVFPYLLFCFSWPMEILKRCVISFVSGCFFACLYLIARASLFAFNGRPEYFFYNMFSDFIHVSYFAMYLILAIAFVVLFYEHWFKAQKSIIYSSYFFISIFITSIFLCSSKLGLISLFICIPLLVFYKWEVMLKFRMIVALFIALLLAGAVAARLFPEAFRRLNSLAGISRASVDKTSSESTTVRMLIWKECLELIDENIITGTGVGDANDELYHSYQLKGLTGALAHKLNAHNQFLQTFIGMGIIGFAFLLSVTVGDFVCGIIRRNFLLCFFSLVIILNFMVESMLQTSAGVLFFTFFYCFFNLVDEAQLRE